MVARFVCCKAGKALVSQSPYLWRKGLSR